MDLHKVRMQLEALGYRAVNLKEMTTFKGIAASWQVVFGSEVVARCFDAGDGGSLSIQWCNRNHCQLFQEAGKVLCDIEPEALALIALSIS